MAACRLLFCLLFLMLLPATCFVFAEGLPKVNPKFVVDTYSLFKHKVLQKQLNEDTRNHGGVIFSSGNSLQSSGKPIKQIQEKRERYYYSLISAVSFRNISLVHLSYFLIAVLIVYIIIQYRTRTLRRSNKLLRERDITAKVEKKQKVLLSLRNKNIEDSLKYAQRIQQAILHNQKALKAILPQSFAMHEPKELVSGDFFWIHEEGERVFLAAVDCTGHGIPGAFMSIIGVEFLRKIIIIQKITDPAEILNELNRNFEEIFANERGEYIVQDGMDLSVCVFDKVSNMLIYAGAFNPVYIIRDNKLIELQADSYSIGADTFPYLESEKTFNSQMFQLQKNDMIYLFTDGYPDQFGGPEGKKFKYRRFRHLLLTIHTLPLESQKQYLAESMESWRGSQEQTDDILVIGVKPEI